MFSFAKHSQHEVIDSQFSWVLRGWFRFQKRSWNFQNPRAGNLFVFNFQGCPYVRGFPGISGFWDLSLKGPANKLFWDPEKHKNKYFKTFRSPQIFFSIFLKFFGPRSLHFRAYFFLTILVDFIWIFEISGFLKIYSPVPVSPINDWLLSCRRSGKVAFVKK